MWHKDGGLQKYVLINFIKIQEVFDWKKHKNKNAKNIIVILL